MGGLVGVAPPHITRVPVPLPLPLLHTSTHLDGDMGREVEGVVLRVLVLVSMPVLWWPSMGLARHAARRLIVCVCVE